MPLFRQRTAINALGLVIAILATSCGETKVAQCNKLAEVINKGEPLATDFQEESAKSGSIFAKITNSQEAKAQATQVATNFNQFARDWESLNQEVQTIDLVDETIIGLQQRYVQTGNEFVQGMQDLGQVMVDLSRVEATQEGLETLKKVSSDFSTVSQKMVSVGQQSDEVVSELNNYCSGS
jgi:hypothetical protein